MVDDHIGVIPVVDVIGIRVLVFFPPVGKAHNRAITGICSFRSIIGTKLSVADQLLDLGNLRLQPLKVFFVCNMLLNNRHVGNAD